jgi:hypothetical protein
MNCGAVRGWAFDEYLGTSLLANHLQTGGGNRHRATLFRNVVGELPEVSLRARSLIPLRSFIRMFAMIRAGDPRRSPPFEYSQINT